jgi:BMFP domain-containing protein YqiC
MTSLDPHDRDRLARLEGRVDSFESWLARINDEQIRVAQESRDSYAELKDSLRRIEAQLASQSGQQTGRDDASARAWKAATLVVAVIGLLATLGWIGSVNTGEVKRQSVPSHYERQEEEIR